MEKVGRVNNMGDWSSGMIPALGAGGPGFNPRIAPFYHSNIFATHSTKPPLRQLPLALHVRITQEVSGSCQMVIDLDQFYYFTMHLQERRERSRSRSKSSSQGGKRRFRDQDDDEFQANQEIIRSLLRIEQRRQQPIDTLVKIMWIYKDKYAYDSSVKEIMDQPKRFLNGLTPQQLQDLIPSTYNFEKAEQKVNSKYVRYWQSLRTLVQAVMANKQGENAINQAFRAKVDEILKKSDEQLQRMEKMIDSTLSSRGGSNDSFWKAVKMRLGQKRTEADLKRFYEQFRQTHKEQEAKQQDIGDEFDEPISPVLQPASKFNPKIVTSEEQEVEERQALAQRIFKEEFEKAREKLEQNLSLPKNHNLLSTSIISENTQTYDIITQQIIEFEKYKRMQEDEQEFDDWVPCQTEGRFRDRRPQYINRKRVKIEWNKYNTMHYNDDNPPPKSIIGYKFNIFYPDLYDKLKTPQYYLETTQSPDDCIIKFKAGPPYLDIAFKIQRREWDFTEKSGFESIFHRGILQLYFNFKKPKFRI